MELLITLIGNAAVDPTFRERFLNNPADTLDKYGFRLTKCDYELMMLAFGKATTEQRKQLEEAFATLQTRLYDMVKGQVIGPCRPPCFWSIYPPPEIRKAEQKAA